MKAAPVACLALLNLLAAQAQATTDGGESARLLTLTGGDRYAVISYDSVQAGCGESACDVFHIDLEHAEFQRRAVRRVGEAPGNQRVSIGEVFYQYRLRLPEDERVRLGAPWGGPVRELAVDTAHSTPGAVRFELPGGGTLRVELEELWTVASMAPYDRLSDRLCLEKDQALCSSCAREVRWLDGEKRSTWACKGPGQWRGDQRPCDCGAQARMLRLRMTEATSGRTVVGSKILIEPFRLAQVWMNGPAVPAEMGIALGVSSGVFHSDLQALAVPRGILVFGSASHAPTLNGTYLPVVGFFPYG